MAQAKKKLRFGYNYISITDSKLVEKVYYDPETSTLDAVFKTGKRYRYRGVKPKTFAEFVLAKSMGKYFNAKIRTKYQYQPVT